MSTIQDHVISEAIRLSRELHALSANLADRQIEIAGLQVELGQHKRDRDALKSAIIITRGGYSALGKNEKEREIALDDICNRQVDYREADNAVNRTADEISLAQADFSALCRQYNAVAHQSQSNAATMALLAGPAGQSMIDLPVPIPSPDSTKGAQPEDLGL